jgi:heme A synthase
VSASRPVRFAWAVLGYNLLVILWGALVRATGSGAGCGSHWPLCDGEVVPEALSGARAVEFAHRVSSGLALVAVVALGVVVFRSRPRRHPARSAAVASLVFVLLEAGIGAGLVLFELVAGDASRARAVAIAAHLVNTLFLLGALTRTARRLALAEGAAPPRLAPAAWLVLPLLVLAGASGAIAALGDTLFPARSLGEALAQDLSAGAHWLLRLRLAHPALAAAAAAAVLLHAFRRAVAPPGAADVRRWAVAAGALAVVQLGVGVVNVALLAPIPLQLVHLLLADLLWIATLVCLETSP